MTVILGISMVASRGSDLLVSWLDNLWRDTAPCSKANALTINRDGRFNGPKNKT